MGDKIDVTINIYGNVTIAKVLCPKCGDYSFLLDGFTACCDEEIFPDGDVALNSVVSPENRRYPIGKSQRERILEEQSNKCIYCGIKFGDYYEKDGKNYYAKPNWDHIIPFAFSRNNHVNNYVASCRICNLIKHSKIFKTIEEAREYILIKRKEKGIKIIEQG